MNDETVSLAEAAALLGVSRPTLLAIIDREGLSVYLSPVDRRRKFLRRAAIEQLAQRAQVLT